MKEPFAHGMMPAANHDERARENFVVSSRIHVEENITPGDELVYEGRGKARFTRQHGFAPRHHHDIRRAMRPDPYYQMWSALTRTLKEMIWDDVGDSVLRQLPDLIERAKPRSGARGTLTLDPALPVPRYNATVDIHAMPGGYHSEIAPDDVYAGALYDRGGYYVVMSLVGSKGHGLQERPGALVMEGSTRNALHYLRQYFPELRPRRILDLGCAVGTSTLPYCDAFPEAEVFAVDYAAPLLRYGHARAEALDKRVHFSQQNAERTNFASNSFDLVVTHAVAHETSGKAWQNILSECFRLLRRGGVTIHTERKFFTGLSPHEAFVNDWDTYHENEPFKGRLRSQDPEALLHAGGFASDKTFFVGASRAMGGVPTFTRPGDPRAFGSLFGAVK
ncbi:MAG: class I SAM-dependent methyltransferase [Alphaproteobacteria bacterium]|nr:class I SAM-dependent methyltransferase [Alphaproteobacteria bacterium]